MRIISTKVHGYLDYSLALLLIASPWLFGFYRGDRESGVLIALGVGTILYSLITDYELGLAKALSMKTHLALDLIAGVVLAASPWLFDFSETIFLPHLIFGLGEIAAVMMTKPIPEFGTKYKANQ